MITAKSATDLCNKHEVVEMLARVANDRVLEACSRNQRHVEGISVPRDVQDMMVVYFESLGYKVESGIRKGDNYYVNIYWD